MNLIMITGASQWLSAWLRNETIFCVDLVHLDMMCPSNNEVGDLVFNLHPKPVVLWAIIQLNEVGWNGMGIMIVNIYKLKKAQKVLIRRQRMAQTLDEIVINIVYDKNIVNGICIIK
eukprot:785542_1